MSKFLSVVIKIYSKPSRKRIEFSKRATETLKTMARSSLSKTVSRKNR